MVENKKVFLYLEHILCEYKKLHCSTGAVEDLFSGLFAGIEGRETKTQGIKETLETKAPR